MIAKLATPVPMRHPVLLMAVATAGAIVTNHVVIRGAVAINTDAAYATTAGANADQSYLVDQRSDRVKSTCARSGAGVLTGQRSARWV